MAVERSPSGSSLIDVLDRVLDKGIVIDAWVRVSLVGIELATVEARIVVASIDTYLKYSEAVGLSAPISRPRELTQGGAEELERMRSENADLKRRLARLQGGARSGSLYPAARRRASRRAALRHIRGARFRNCRHVHAGTV